MARGVAVDERCLTNSSSTPDEAAAAESIEGACGAFDPVSMF